MLSEIEFLRYAIKTHALRSSAKQYLAMSRSMEPFRRVGVGARKNVCSEFASTKMGRALQTESHTAERAFALICEYDERVLEIWDQPQPLIIERTDNAYSADVDHLVRRRYQSV